MYKCSRFLSSTFNSTTVCISIIMCVPYCLKNIVSICASSLLHRLCLTQVYLHSTCFHCMYVQVGCEYLCEPDHNYSFYIYVYIYIYTYIYMQMVVYFPMKVTLKVIDDLSILMSPIGARFFHFAMLNTRG